MSPICQAGQENFRTHDPNTFDEWVGLQQTMDAMWPCPFRLLWRTSLPQNVRFAPLLSWSSINGLVETSSRVCIFLRAMRNTSTAAVSTFFQSIRNNCQVISVNKLRRLCTIALQWYCWMVGVRVSAYGKCKLDFPNVFLHRWTKDALGMLPWRDWLPYSVFVVA